MGVFRDLSGQKFGALTAVRREGSYRKKALWRCRCDCGNDASVSSDRLVSGNTKSCGCARQHHGHAVRGKMTPTYRSWHSMICRCTNAATPHFDRYGGRGIGACASWVKFENFLADMGERPSLAHTIDRVDNNGNYEPNNCRWATRREQANNRSTNRLFEFAGEQLTYREIARRTGLSDELLRHRLLRAGWSVDRAINPEHKPGRRRRGAQPGE